MDQMQLVVFQCFCRGTLNITHMDGSTEGKGVQVAPCKIVEGLHRAAGQPTVIGPVTSKRKDFPCWLFRHIIRIQLIQHPRSKLPGSIQSVFRHICVQNQAFCQALYRGFHQLPHHQVLGQKVCESQNVWDNWMNVINSEVQFFYVSWLWNEYAHLVTNENLMNVTT